jgi:mannobiose 2-epimerase
MEFPSAPSRWPASRQRPNLLWAGLLILTLDPRPLAAQDVARQEIESALKQSNLEVWFPRTVDNEQGGFLCDFDREWRPAGKQPKTIVFQSRMTWLASRAAEQYPAQARYLEAARHGFRFLETRMWDRVHGGWYWSLDRAGQITPEWQGAKHAYGLGFGIYACAAYARAAKSPEPLERARQAFAWLEEHAHDAKYCGYNEFLTREGVPILTTASSPLGRDRDCLGTRIGYKSMNTHIHLLEAFTALYEQWPDARLKARTMELLTLIRDKVVAPPGAMHQFFNPDWVPVPDCDSIGHDVETAYLLLEAAEALGMKDDPKMVATAKSLLDHALAYGWDRADGGFYDTCGTFGPVHDARKVWWSQAEGLNALLLMSRRFPQDPLDYRKLFDRQWRYIEKTFMDKEHGGWYPVGLDSGGDRDAAKASEWKAGYHDGRALFKALKWLEATP